MKATDQIKHAAFEKTLDYLLEDPERNATKIMDMLDKVAPVPQSEDRLPQRYRPAEQLAPAHHARARAESRDAQRLHQDVPR